MRSANHIEALRRDITLFKESVTKFAGLLAGKDVKVVFRGGECSTDGDTIVLPAVDALETVPKDQMHLARRFIESMIGYVGHEVGHVLCTDFNLWKSQANQSKQVRALGNVVEDIFVERRMTELWKGTAENFERYTKNLIEERKAFFLTKDSFTQLCLLFGLLCRGPEYDYAHEYFDPELVAWATKNLTRWVDKARRVQSTDESLSLARKLSRYIAKAFKTPPPPPPPPPSPVPSDEKDAEGEEEQDEDKSAEGGAAQEDAEGEPAKPEQSDEQGDDLSAEAQASEGQDKTQQASNDAEPESLASRNDGSAEDNKTEADNETDHQAGVRRQYRALTTGQKASYQNVYAVYTTEKDYIGPMRRELMSHWNPWHWWYREQCHWSKRPDMMPALAHVQALADEAVGPLRSAMTRVLKAQGTAYEVRDLDAGVLDRRRLWKVPHANQMPVTPRVRKQSMQAATYNLAVVIAVNESHSMALPADAATFGDMRPVQRPAGFAEKITRMDMAGAAALALGDVLHGLKIKFGIFGHTTGGEDGDIFRGETRYRRTAKADRALLDLFCRFGDLCIEWVKGFDEVWPQRRRYIGGLYPQGNTYDSEVVRYAARQLGGIQGVSRRILIMLDDGEPCPEMAEKYMTPHRHALVGTVRDVQKSGIEVLGLGMACDVSRYYPNHVTVKNVAELPQVLLGQFGKMLRSP